MTNNELIALAVTGSDNDIILRIDKNGFGKSQFEGFPVVELKLMACSDAVRAFNALNESIDNPIAYEIVKNNDKVIVSFWINYLPDELQVVCIQTDETLMDYTLEDWKCKANRLAKLYASSTETNELDDYTYRLLKSTLSKMIQKELDLYQHKIDFLVKTNPEKAATLTGQTQAYQKVLTLIGLGEENGQAIAPQIRDAISQIWSDKVWHQSTYAALVESKIADMGKAALFPLLEIVKDPGAQHMRDEAILILGLIDPEVKEKLLETLQPDNKPA